MGERAKVILNEYSAKNLLMRDTLDLDKFYTTDLKLFVEVARKEILRLQTQLQQKENIIKEVREINMYIYNNLANIDYGEVKCKINRVLEILDKE